jgi:glutamate/tyrosine decarboxylase-like PLP-dependent enzyme
MSRPFLPAILRADNHGHEPQAIPVTDLSVWLPRAVDAVARWQDEFGPAAPHPSLMVDDDRLAEAFAALVGRLRDNYPFGHPHYVGQMLKPPHPAAVLGYVTAMLINPNNHALDGGPATARMEREAVAALAGMLGLPEHLGHLTSSGTIANLEALWVARETHPGRAIAYSADAHYTHARMCGLLGVEGAPVPTDRSGRMDVDALDRLLGTGRVGTVVATLGTTGLGALDPVDRIVEVAGSHGVRTHVDAAYGGFFALVADDEPTGLPRAPFAAVGAADSVVIDPHKHGLQPYGCGAVLFRDPAIGRHYAHDSPYTYFSSDDLHLGEISLECSRAGAAAAALWFTLQVMPLTPDGLGAALRANLAGAREWAALLSDEGALRLFQEPDLDIVTYWPVRATLAEVDAASADVFRSAADGPPPDQVHVATYSASAGQFVARGHAVTVDADHARILRSVVMKPESAARVAELHRRLSGLAAPASGTAT